MKISDYEQVSSLWDTTEGMGKSESDSRENVKKYLRRNPGMSFVAEKYDGEIVGTILSGHDGKRAFIYHLAVDKSCRRLGIGKQLVDKCIKKIKTLGIPKCTLFVYETNIGGQKFWKSMKWFVRKELVMMQYWTNE